MDDTRFTNPKLSPINPRLTRNLSNVGSINEISLKIQSDTNKSNPWWNLSEFSGGQSP